MPVAAKEHPQPSEDQAFAAELAAEISAHSSQLGANPTAIPGLVLFKRTCPSACYQGSYEPSINVFAQGKKRIKLGHHTYQVDASSFLLSSIDVPVESQILEASAKKPLLSLLLRLDMTTVREIIAIEELPNFHQTESGSGLCVGHTTSGLFDVCCRLIRLIDSPADIPFMSRHIQREMIYRILCTPRGQRLRAIASSGDVSHRTSKAIAWLKMNFAKRLRIEELAEVSRMGVSTLHHQFRALTAMSPLQYQKHLRLTAARQRMLMDGLDVTSAALEVGYESVSQFSREYSRMFGQPPMRDIRVRRSNGGAELHSV